MKPQDHRLAAIVIMDIDGFDKLMESYEQEVLSFLAFYTELVKRLAEDNRGHVIKIMSGTCLIDFPTALDAVRCALSVQDRMQQYRQNNQFQIQLRIGIHLGDIYYFYNDALGEGINIASRLQALCEPGMITISQKVYNQVSGKLQFVSQKMGLVVFKDTKREIIAYKIIPKEDKAQSESVALKPEPHAPENNQQTGSRWMKVRNPFTSLIDYVIERKIAKYLGKNFKLQHYKARKLKDIEKTTNLAGILGHSIAFVGINTFLIWLNSTFSAFPWSGIAFLGWGIGFFGHLGTALGQKSSKKILKKIEDLNETEGHQFIKYLEKNESLLPSFTITTMVSALLLYIQSVTTGFHIFPWSILVSFILGVGFLGNFFSWIANWKALGEFLQRHGEAIIKKSLQKFKDSIREIRRLLKQINPSLEPLSKELGNLSFQYYDQIKKLVRIEKNIKDALKKLPSIRQLEKEEQRIKELLEKNISKQRKEENTRALELIQQQIKSRSDLEERYKLVKDILKNYEKSLQQNQLDLVKVLTHDANDQSDVLKGLIQRFEGQVNDIIDISEKLNL